MGISHLIDLAPFVIRRSSVSTIASKLYTRRYIVIKMKLWDLSRAVDLSSPPLLGRVSMYITYFNASAAHSLAAVQT